MSTNSSQNKPIALVVEDDPQLIGIYTIAMEVAGFATETASDGRQAMDQLRQIVPDVILLDVHLPYVSGDAILRHIRSDSTLQQATVVLSTADTRIAAHIREEANMVLLKPISFRELVDLAKSLFALEH